MQEDDCFTKRKTPSRCLGAIRDLVLNIANIDGDGKIKNYIANFNSKFSTLLADVRSVEIFELFSKFGILRT